MVFLKFLKCKYVYSYLIKKCFYDNVIEGNNVVYLMIFLSIDFIIKKLFFNI